MQKTWGNVSKVVENFGQIGKFYSGCPKNSLKSPTSPGALSHERESMLTITLEALHAAL